METHHFPRRWMLWHDVTDVDVSSSSFAATWQPSQPAEFTSTGSDGRVGQVPVFIARTVTSHHLTRHSFVPAGHSGSESIGDFLAVIQARGDPHRIVRPVQ